MRALKFISFTILLSFFAGFLFSSSAFAQDNLENALAEFENDDVTAKSLDIEEPKTLPGDTWYWWQGTKENVGLWFTFNKEKKLQKLEEENNNLKSALKEIKKKFSRKRIYSFKIV